MKNIQLTGEKNNRRGRRQNNDSTPGRSMHDKNNNSQIHVDTA